MIDAADSLSHRTMLMVLYSTGMRKAELRHLQVEDIDSRRMLIHIQRGKGGRDRYVPLSPTLLTTLRAYYRWMRPKTWLFPGTVRRLARRQAHYAQDPVGRVRRRGSPRRCAQAVLAAPRAPFLCDTLTGERRSFSGDTPRLGDRPASARPPGHRPVSNGTVGNSSVDGSKPAISWTGKTGHFCRCRDAAIDRRFGD